MKVGKNMCEELKVSVDVKSSVDEYINKHDWRVNANANQGFSLGGLILNVSGKIIANYWLNFVYKKEIGDLHKNGDIHIHDLDMLSGYCAGWSLKNLLIEGFNGVQGKVESRPPKHLSSALGQMINFLGTMQNEWAGAQAFSSFDTYLAPFIRLDSLSYSEVYQNIQEFVYNLNVPSRWGTQTPFTNLTLDWVCPEDLRNMKPTIGGVEMPFVYGDLQKEMDMINKAFLEVMTNGDKKGRAFTFPIPTYNITKDFNWDHENCDLLFEVAAKYGIPYFQNFVNSDLSPQMVRSMCCRLQLDLRELLKRGNGLFGSAEQTGSIGVVTLNMSRIGYLNKNKEDFYKRLDELLSFAKKSLEIKRSFISSLMEQGIFPFTKRFLGTLRNHFSTIGINGMNECIRNYFNDGTDIYNQKGIDFTLEVLKYINEKLIQFQIETGNLYNLEATPAEGATYRFAKEDLKLYPDIKHAGTTESPYYTNSTQLPYEFDGDILDMLKHQETMQKNYTGGTVLHLFTKERIADAKTCKKLVKRSLELFKLPYITVTPTFSICPVHGYIKGEHQFCKLCDEELLLKLHKNLNGTLTNPKEMPELKEQNRQRCEIWSRVMGYYRPVSQFNIGKKQEFKERPTFNSTSIDY
jgi:ribonucleoside-triphosphate reductase